jgi:serine/threonine-protein kinase
MRYTPGGQIFVKVLDFGIAKQISEEGQGHKLTATGAVMGTPAYMAPEQAGGQPLTARADQYATGIVLYELLTGVVPFNSRTMAGVITAHLTQPPPELPREIPEPLRKIVMRLLAKDPTDRFESCAKLDQALADCESACRDIPALRRGATDATAAPAAITATATTPPPAAPSAGRSRGLILGGAFAAAACLIGGVVVLAPKTPKPTTPPATTTATPTTTPATPTTTGGGDPQPSPDPAAATAGTPTGTPPAPSATKADPKNPLPAALRTMSRDGGESKPAPTPVAGGPSSKPVSKPAAAAEPPDVKEKLDRVDALLRAGTWDEAANIALKTTFSNPTPRAYRQLVTAYCNLGDLSHATTHFHRVAGADKRALVALCRKHDIDLH